MLIIRGTVRGDCEGSKKVEITATGKVFGNIASRAIVVAEGATFRGASKMAQADPSKPEEAAASPSRDANAPSTGSAAATSSTLRTTQAN